MFGENEIPDIRAKAEKARQLIAQTFKVIQQSLIFAKWLCFKKCIKIYANKKLLLQIIQVEEEKQLQDYDFPAALERDCKAFEIDYIPKIVLIGKVIYI